MTLDLRKSFISGRPRHLTSPPAVPAGLHVALIVLGAGPGALERILPHALLKFPGPLPALAPPRILVRGQKIPSPGMVEAAAARKARAVGRTVLAAKALRGASFVLDLTPAAEVVLRRLAKVPPKQRHPLLLAALAAWVPDLSGYGQVITVLEYPLGDIPLDERVLLLNKATFAADHVLLEAATGGPQLGDVVRDPSLLFLANLGTGTVVRLDPADRHTTGKRRFIMAIRASEHALAPHLPEAIAGAAALPRPAPQAAGEPDQLPDEIADVAPGAVPDPAQQRREERIAALREAHARVPFPTLSGPARPLAEILVAGPIRPPTVSVAPGTFADPAVTRPSFAAITTSYVAQGHYDRDLASALDSLSRDPVAPTFVEEVTREDTSDGLTTKETMTVRLRDAAGRSGTLHVDLPTISHDGYLHLQGVKYHIAKQIMALPIIKVRPDEVLVTTAYNKAMVSRFGQNASARTAYVRRLAIALDRERAPGVTVELGSATAANAGFTSTVEYDDLARTLRSIRSGRGALVFSRPALAAQLPGVAPWAAPLLAGLERAGGHAIGWETSREGRPPSVLATDAAGDLLVLRKGAKEPEALGLGIDELVALGVGDRAPPPSAEDKKYAFSRTKMLSQYLPTITIAGFCDGLARTLRRAGVDFAIVDPQAFRRSTLGPGRAFVRFSDAVLTYDARRLAHSLLVNGLRDADTGERKIADYGPQGQGWADQIAERLGSPGHVKGLLNFRASFVDPATAELLAAEGIPTDMAGILLHASAMLESNGHRDANDISNYRIRGPELIPALLYKALHREMERVRATRESAIPQRLSIAQGEIVRQVLGASNVEEVADLNPLLEAELRGKATWTGAAGGLSDGRVVNLAMRTFHPSMKGVFGYYSPDSSEIGVKRSLTYGVSVLDHRGRLAPRPESPGAAELLALGELISPFTARHSDPPRTGMQSKQGTHTFPTKRHTPLLVGSGASGPWPTPSATRSPTRPAPPDGWRRSTRPRRWRSSSTTTERATRSTCRPAAPRTPCAGCASWPPASRPRKRSRKRSGWACVCP